METEPQFEEFIEAAIPIVEDASKIALSYFRQAILIETKENMTPVTVADKKTEETLRRDFMTAFPGFGIIGEEFGEESKDADLVWTIDPIDGTLSFIRGIPLFGTLVGLLYKGEPVGGICVLPALAETYSAAQGSGTYCNGHQLHVAAAHTLESSFISAGDFSWFKRAGHLEVLKQLQQKAHYCRGYTDCFAHTLVVRGAMDAMIDPEVSLWDVAPLASLIEEAGGEYFDFEGNRTIYGKSFVSCSAELKNELLKAITASKGASQSLL